MIELMPKPENQFQQFVCDALIRIDSRTKLHTKKIDKIEKNFIKKRLSGSYTRGKVAGILITASALSGLVGGYFKDFIFNLLDSWK